MSRSGGSARSSTSTVRTVGAGVSPPSEQIRLGPLDPESVHLVRVELAGVGPHREERLDVATRNVDLGDDPGAPADLLDGAERAVGELDREAVGRRLVALGRAPTDVPRRDAGEWHVGVELDERLSLDRRRIEDGVCAAGDLLAHVPADACDDPGGDLLGFGEAHEHLGVDGILRTRADRIVGRVLDDPSPGELEEAGRPGRPVEGGERLGHPLEEPFGPPGGLLDVGPVARDAHEHVGPGARTGARRATRRGRPCRPGPPRSPGCSPRGSRRRRGRGRRTRSPRRRGRRSRPPGANGPRRTSRGSAGRRRSARGSGRSGRPADGRSPGPRS